MRSRGIPLTALILVLGANLTSYDAAAGDCRCTHCGDCDSCQKVCRLVCEEKKVEVICWGCVCETFCLAKHNKLNCEHCQVVCADCDAPGDPDAPHVKPKRFLWKEWLPGSATMHTRKKLMKKTEAVTVRSFKWIVEDLCPRCESCCDIAAAGPKDDVPTPPKVTGAKLVYRLK